MLFDIILTHTKTKDVLRLELSEPREEPPDDTSTVRRFIVAYKVDFEGKVSEGEAYGGTWLWALQNAVRSGTYMVEDETEWEDAYGLPAWVVLQRAVPITWGYEFYKSVVESIKRKETVLFRRLEKRRKISR